MLVLCGMAGPGHARDLVVFAAASLKTALDTATQEFTALTGTGIAVSYGGSSVLARQIGFGAPADVFISASADWMDDLATRGLIDAETRYDLLGNRLVLIAHGADQPPVVLDQSLDLDALLQGKRMAMALVDAVPAGIYGKAAWTTLGLWSGVEGAVAQTDNVRAALALVATGEAPLGVVYATDAAASETVSVIAHFPADSHPPITYPVAAISGVTHPETQKFLSFLAGPDAAETFKRHGFAVLTE
jgi:molybdate transport system substrate-binding protein